ncbi:hypothetical protein [Streptomyces pseudovenezuelae]|uniref:Uncharacterized protein n=1 Tax=Streptomyces pseudovenezuelae TaxID=67350 RepID=A0ABT6LLI7_9ACTN|nr:hypothetical protein [Streptomyces pseudovenezuelae]MDH6217172.1 hypothetical protein [Streptomyces pseudovenezuelae]
MYGEEAAKTRFAQWLLCHARLAGYDVEAAGMRATLLIVTSMALSGGLDAAITVSMAAGLAVTPQELTDAYTDEMHEFLHMRRASELADLRSHPDLAGLEETLDSIDRTA